MQKRRLSKLEASRRLTGRPAKPADTGPSEPGGVAGPFAAERFVRGHTSSPDGQINLREFIRRLEIRLERCRLTAHAAALRAGLSPSQIPTMRRQYELGQQRGVSIRTVAKLATALHTTPEWLLSGTGPEEAPQNGGRETPEETLQQTPEETPQHTPQHTHPHSSQPVGLRLAGSVAAGVWVEPASGNIGPQLAVIPADPRYPAQHQSAFEVRDTSMDRVARPGDFLIVVDRQAAQLPLRTGDIVIVAQRKSDLQEVTARRFSADATDSPEGCRLDYESSDPRFAITRIPDIQKADPIISIGGVVVSVYRPLILTR